MSSTFFRRTTALLAGAATLAASALIAAPAATAGLPPSPYTLSVVASGASPYYLSLPEGVALDSNGNLFVADSGQFGVKMIAPDVFDREPIYELDGLSLDRLDVECTQYQPAPELLSALTDITSFASGRATTYTLLLVFYVSVVAIVVWLCGKLRVRLERRQVVA